MTKISVIIRGVQAERDMFGRTYWNDRLKDGSRSLKVPAFGLAEYALLSERLQNAGFGTKLVQGQYDPFSKRRPLRLHVRES